MKWLKHKWMTYILMKDAEDLMKELKGEK